MGPMECDEMKLRQLLRPRDKIATALIGGLGNQMFQYAAGRAQALRLGCELVLDTTQLHEKGRHTPRHYALDAYNIQAAVDTLSPSKLRLMLPVNESALARSQMLAARPGSRLNGYWQSERHFEHIRKHLLDEFSLKAAPSPYVASMAERIRKATHGTSIHFRRGDYVSNPSAAEFHGVCPDRYYRDALAELHRAGAAPELFVFTDDPQWVNQHAPLPTSHVLVDCAQSTSAEDIWLMSLCRHHVIANSSFSWWGAWLGDQQQGITIAPKRWLLDTTTDTCDIVPDRWTRL